jgi:hypothetical protein
LKILRVGPATQLRHPGLRQQAHGAHVVGLDPKFILAGDLAQGLEIGLGLDQALGGQDHLLARRRELAAQTSSQSSRRSSWRREQTVSPR